MISRVFIIAIFWLCVGPFASAQKLYTFDHLLEYEVRSFQRQTLATQLTLINSKDNSYYALLTRLEDGTLEVFLEDKEISRYLRLILKDELKDSQVLVAKKNSFKKIRCNLPEKRRPRIVNVRDSLINDKPFSLFDMKPESTSTYHGGYPYTYKYWIDASQSNFVPNLTGELCTDDWNNYEVLPKGIVSKQCVVDDKGQAAACSTLKSLEPVTVTIQTK